MFWSLWLFLWVEITSVNFSSDENWEAIEKNIYTKVSEFSAKLLSYPHFFDDDSGVVFQVY